MYMKHSTVDLLAKNTFSSYLWASIRKTSLYAAADRIAFEGLHKRTDIGARALKALNG